MELIELPGKLYRIDGKHPQTAYYRETRRSIISLRDKSLAFFFISPIPLESSRYGKFIKRGQAISEKLARVFRGRRHDKMKWLPLALLGIQYFVANGQYESANLRRAGLSIGEFTIEKEVVVTCTIGVEKDDSAFEDYDEELISAMDSMAPALLPEARKMQLRAEHNIQSVFQPTTITDHTMIGKLNVSTFMNSIFRVTRMQVWSHFWSHSYVITFLNVTLPLPLFPRRLS